MMSAGKTKVIDAHLLSFVRHETEVGSLVVYEGDQEEEFVPSRTYFLYDIPSDAERGGHAHKSLEQIIVALSGSFDVVLNDGQSESIVTLNQPTIGLRLPPGLWRELRGFSGGAICLVLASDSYDEDDYIRGYEDFKSWKIGGDEIHR